MKNLTFRALILLISLSFLSSCGKQDSKDDTKEKIQVLETSRNIVSAPAVWVDFGSVKKSKIAKKQLIFNADLNGELVLSKNSYGRGRGCIDSSGRDDYLITYEYEIKRKGEKSFKPLYLNDEKNKLSFFDFIKLNDGDVLLITMVLEPFVSCSFIQVSIMAQFS